jgi:formylglycine-generating enzyme required for sulfatase activity
LDPYAWHTGNAAGNDPPVGAKKPNGWGLYDMHGYLWEFVADTWHEKFEGAPDKAQAWEASAMSRPRVIRGGSWRDRHELLRSTTRWPVPDHARSDAVGFRCVKVKVSPGRSQ